MRDQMIGDVFGGGVCCVGHEFFLAARSGTDKSSSPFTVMAGLDPAIHVADSRRMSSKSMDVDVDTRIKSGHDKFRSG
jgi:hypothetical protein